MNIDLKFVCRCGKSFIRYCDQDSDRRISRQEWKSCIGITENSEYIPQYSTFLLSKYTIPSLGLKLFSPPVSFSLFSALLSEEDEERAEGERRRKEEQRSPASRPAPFSRETQGDQGMDNFTTSISFVGIEPLLI